MKRSGRIAAVALGVVAFASVAWFVNDASPRVDFLDDLQPSIAEQTTETIMYQGRPTVAKRITLKAGYAQVQSAIAKRLPRMGSSLMLGMGSPALQYESADPGTPVQSIELRCGRLLPPQSAQPRNAEGWVTLWVVYRPTAYAQLLDSWRSSTRRFSRGSTPKSYFVGDGSVQWKSFDAWHRG